MSCSQSHRKVSRTERVTPHAEFMMVGGSAIRLEPKTPDMIDYNRQMYHDKECIELPFKDINLSMNHFDNSLTILNIVTAVYASYSVVCESAFIVHFEL